MADRQKEVLIVDDEPQVRELTRRALVASGLACDTASDGEEAMRMVGRKPYDGVITDLRMPRRHGQMLCADLARLPQPPPVLVMTAMTDPRLVENLLSQGVYDVVHKPVNYLTLAAEVQKMLLSPRAPSTAIGGAPPAKRSNLLHLIESSLVDLTELFGERLDMVFESTEEMPDPPPAVRNFIRRLALRESSPSKRPRSVVLPGHEGRERERVTCYATATATPVNRDWEPVGQPFKLALRDLSESGCRTLYTRATNAEHLALRWNATQLVAKQIRVVTKIRRCKPLGPFYDIGGQFVMPD